MTIALLAIFGIGCSGGGDDNGNGASTAELYVSVDYIDFDANTNVDDFFIQNDGDDDLNWSLSVSENWLSCSPTSGSLVTFDYEYVDVTVNRTGLADGTHTANINITSNGGNHTIEITLIVSGGGSGSDLFVSQDTLDFGETQTDITFFLQNDGSTDISWTLSDDASWLSATPNNGVLTAPSGFEFINATVDRSGLNAGAYSATITIVSTAGNATVDVFLTVPGGGGPTALIYTDNFTYSGNGDLDLMWDCGDNDSNSDLVYWGMADWDNTQDIDAPPSGDTRYLHCAGRNGYSGEFYEYYENDMDAYMQMTNSLDLSTYSDLSVKFNWAIETESGYDYVRVYVGNPTNGWELDTSGEFDDGTWNWRTDEIALSSYGLSAAQLADFRVKIVFYSDESFAFDHGCAIDKMEIWGIEASSR